MGMCKYFLDEWCEYVCVSEGVGVSEGGCVRVGVSEGGCEGVGVSEVVGMSE